MFVCCLNSTLKTPPKIEITPFDAGLLLTWTETEQKEIITYNLLYVQVFATMEVQQSSNFLLIFQCENLASVIDVMNPQHENIC